MNYHTYKISSVTRLAGRGKYVANIDVVPNGSSEYCTPKQWMRTEFNKKYGKTFPHFAVALTYNLSSADPVKMQSHQIMELTFKAGSELHETMFAMEYL